AAGEIVAGADAGEYPVHQVEPCTRGRHERAHLCQQNDQRCLPQIGRLAAHVRTGENDDQVRAAVQVEIVGNKAFVAAGQLGLLDDRVPALDNLEVAAVVEHGT